MSLFHTTIGWLAPADCIGCGQEGSALCQACTVAEILPYGEHCSFCGVVSMAGRTCPKCRASAPRHVWVVSDYSDLAQVAVHAYKFGHLRAVAEPMAELMADTIVRFTGVEELKHRNYLVVYVPTATSRRRQRGFDQAELLAESLAAKIGLRFYPALVRIGQNRQVGTQRARRFAQQKDKYFVRPHMPVSDRNILLVDDVITTGATLKAVARTLRKAGARRIDAAVFAKRI